MSAQELGRSLLAEVKVEGLDELLQSLRALAAPPPPPHHTGVPALDRLLNPSAFSDDIQSHDARTQNLSAQQRHDRPAPPETHPPPSRPEDPPIIELTSPSPGGGKTHLLYYLITTLVLPKTWPGIALHGSGAAVVVLDTDSRFDIPRLAQIMKQHISTLASKTTTAPSTVELEALLMDSLQHVHIFRPDSMASLLTTLDTLPAYLLASATTDTSTANTTTPPPHSSAQRRLGALILDS
ncbi:hypothetical protein LTR66_012921, partial [Elasticomyces elasticus]